MQIFFQNRKFVFIFGVFFFIIYSHTCNSRLTCFLCSPRLHQMNTMMAQKADFEKKIKEFEEQLADEEQFADEIETIKVKGEEKMNKMRGQIGELENKIKGVEEEKRHRDGQIKVRTAVTSLASRRQKSDTATARSRYVQL